MTMTYDQLKQTLQDFLETQETTFINNLPLFIRMAEERILKTIQLTLFRKNSVGALTAGNKYLACPADFLAPNSLSFTDATGKKVFLLLKNVDFVQSYTPDDTVVGSPVYYAMFDVDNFIVAPTPALGSAVELHYLYRPVSLTAGLGSATTWLSENAELTLLYGSLVEAYIFLKGDPDLHQLYDKRFQESLVGLKMLGEARETSEEYRTSILVRKKE